MNLYLSHSLLLHPPQLTSTQFNLSQEVTSVTPRVRRNSMPSSASPDVRKSISHTDLVGPTVNNRSQICLYIHVCMCIYISLYIFTYSHIFVYINLRKNYYSYLYMHYTTLIFNSSQSTFFKLVFTPTSAFLTTIAL